MNSLPTIPDSYCTCNSYYGHLMASDDPEIDFGNILGNQSIDDALTEILDSPDSIIWSDMLLLVVAYISTGTYAVCELVGPCFTKISLLSQNFTSTFSHKLVSTNGIDAKF